MIQNKGFFLTLYVIYRYDTIIYNVFMNPYSHNSLDDSISIRVSSSFS